MGGRGQWYAIAAIVAAAFGQYWLAAGLAAAAVMTAIQKTPDEPIRDYGQKLQFNSRSTQEPVRLIYGKMKVGGNDVYISSGGTDNKQLWIVQTLGEGECEGIDTIGSEEQVWLEEELVSQYPGSIVDYYFHSGTFSQTVDANLAAARPEWTDALRGTCYIVWKLIFNEDYFLRAPARTLVLKGRKLYDFRDTTTAWSDNPVLALYDYMTNTRYGMGIPSAQIDLTSWISAANYCDTKGWTINYTVTSLVTADDVINNILATFRGQLVWYGNSLFLYYTDLNYESSVMPISDEHIAVEEASGKALISTAEPSRFGTPDGLRVGFIDPDKDYSMDNVVVGENIGVIEDYNILACTNKQQAMDLGVYQLERMQHQEVIRGTFRDDLAKLDPHDVVNLTCTSLAISGELLRVQSVDLRPDSLVDITFSAESLLFYDDDYNLTQDSLFECTLPNPKSVPPEVSYATIEEELYWYRLRSFSRLNISFEEPINYPWFSHVEVWRSFDGTNFDYLYDVNTDFSIDPVEEGVTYHIRLRPVSIFGVKRALDQSTTLVHLVLGKTSAPGSLSSITAVPTDLGINVYGTKVTDPDVELYEFRLGGSWTGGVFLGSYRSPNLSLKGVKPGFFVFWCNTLANNEVYGDTPVSASASVQDPKGWSLSAEIPYDYVGGTFSNMERVWYNSEWFLKCSHGGAVLSGEYWSPIFDIEDYDPTVISPETFLAYIEADIVVTGAGTQWQDVLYDGATVLTWAEVVTDRKWYEVFSLPAAPKVSMKLIWGSSPASMDYEAERMEILSTVLTAKYVQAYIRIEDPTGSVYAYVENFKIKLYQ